MWVQASVGKQLFVAGDLLIQVAPVLNAKPRFIGAFFRSVIDAIDAIHSLLYNQAVFKELGCLC